MLVTRHHRSNALDAWWFRCSEKISTLASSGRDIEFAPVDLRGAERSSAAFEPLTGITHIAYTVVHEKPERVAGRPGASRREAAERFEVSVAPAVKWLQRWRDITAPRGSRVVEALRRSKEFATEM